MGKSTQLTYQEQTVQYNSVVEALDRLHNVTRLSEKCVNQTILGQRRDYILQQLSSIQNDTSRPILPLRDSVFNCSALSSCSISCSPPNEVILQE